MYCNIGTIVKLVNQTQQILITSVLAYSIIFWLVGGTLANQLYLIAAAMIFATHRTSNRTVFATTAILIAVHTVYFLLQAKTLTPDVIISQMLLIGLALFTASITGKETSSDNNLSYGNDTLFEQNNDAVFLLNMQGQHLSANQRAVAMLGYDSVEEILNLTNIDLIHPDSVPDAENKLERMLAGEKLPPYERLFRKKDGTPIAAEVNVQLIYDDIGSPIYIQSIVRDITNRKKRQEELRLSELRFRTFFEHAPIAMWQLDYSASRDYLLSLSFTGVRTYLTEHPQDVIECMRRLRIIDVNQRTLDLYHVTNKEELSQLLLSMVQDNPLAHARNRDHIIRLWEGETEFKSTSFMTVNEKTVSNVLLRFKVFPGAEETWERILVSQTDITELTNIETELAAMNAIISEFQTYLTRLHHLTIRLGKLENLDDIYRNAVQTLLEDFGFSRAALFVADYDANLLRGTYGTSPEGEMRPEYDYSEQLSPSTWFDTVLETEDRVTLWEDIELLEYGDNLARGWKAAAALWSGDEVPGYIVVDNYLTGKPPRPYETDLLSLFSHTIGNLISRRKSMMLLQQNEVTTLEFQQHLERLHYVIIDLGTFETLDELYKATIIAARKDFGFERVGLLIADYEADVLRGTYGTSADGEFRAEHDYKEPLTDSPWFGKVLNNEERVTFWEDTDLYEVGEVAKKGWRIAAALRSGTEVFGYIVVDNLLTGRPLRSYEVDLLALFSTKIASQIIRLRGVLELQESQQLLESTFSSLHDAVFILDEDTGLIIDCNRAASELFGYSREEFIGNFPIRTGAFIDSEDNHFEKIARTIADIDDFAYVDLQHKNGDTIYTDIQINPLRTRYNQAAKGWVMVIHDMTERKIMEQEIINLALEKERVTALQHLITNLTHDIATPLSTITTSLYMLKRIQDEARRNEKLATIASQVDAIHATLKSVTQMSRIDVLNPEDLHRTTFSLNNLLRQIAHNFQEQVEKNQLTMTLNLPEETLYYTGDEARLYSAIEYIALNAIQYNVPDGAIEITVEKQENYAHIKIRDTGIGIDEKDRLHIFDRLYRGQHHRPMDGSFGVGLSISLRLVELHYGTIRVESQPGLGSTFTIKLPMGTQQVMAG